MHTHPTPATAGDLTRRRALTVGGVTAASTLILLSTSAAGTPGATRPPGDADGATGQDGRLHAAEDQAGEGSPLPGPPPLRTGQAAALTFGALAALTISTVAAQTRRYEAATAVR